MESLPELSLSRAGRVLTPQQKREYWENGFIVIKNSISKQDLEKFKHRFQEICEKKVKIPGLTVMKDVSIAKSEFIDGEQAINKIQDFQYDDVLFQYCQHPNIVAPVQDLIGSNVLAMHTMLINKPPDSGSKTSRHPMHQDLHYFPFRPADRIICSWTAMERVTRANGCLVVVPKSHKGQLMEHGYPNWEGGVNKMYHGIVEFDPRQHADQLHYAEMEAGDTILFHPILIHGSGSNKTIGFRKAISCHYAAAECYYIDVRGTSQDNIATEVIEVAKKRYGEDIHINFEDAWRLRARVVSGIRSNL